jgi:hypothetical protein
MSNKTIKQRIALVAVTALTAGVLSVATSPVANAATSVDAITGAYCQLYDSTGTVTATATAVTTMYVPVGGTFTISLDDADDNRVTVSAPGLISAVTSGSGNSVDADGLGATVTALATDTVSITAASAGTFKVKTATVAAPGTTVDEITVVVVASCATNSYSEADSLWAVATSVKSTAADLEKEIDSTYTFVDDASAYVSLAAYSGYGTGLPVGTWTATVTGNAVVNINNSTTLTAGDINADVVTTTGTLADNGNGITDGDSARDPGIYVRVNQATSGTAVTTVLTISYNGTAVWSKSLLFTGDLASITVSGADVQAIGGSSLTGIYDVLAKDAAGNLIARVVSGDSSKFTSIVTYVNGGTTTTTGTGALATAANAYWTCAATSGSVKVRLKGTTNAGTTVYSNEFDARCGGAAYTYKASLDKQVYAPGDIATLTVTALDASGFAPFKDETVNADGAVAPSIAGSNMTPINTPAIGDTFNSPIGTKVYTFTVGANAGKYNMAVNLGYSGNSAVSVSYEIKGSSVTNEEILKSIVSLIASINKQIQALQKLILRR